MATATTKASPAQPAYRLPPGAPVPMAQTAKGIPGYTLVYEIRSTCTVISRGKRKVVFQGSGAWTDNKVISLPAIAATATYDIYTARVMRGYANHEAGHCRYTDFDRLKAEMEAIKAIAPHPSKEHVVQVIYKSLTNIFEDKRLEAMIMEEFPGTPRENLAATRDYVTRRNLKRVMEDRAAMDDPAKAKKVLKGYGVVNVLYGALIELCTISNKYPCSPMNVQTLDILREIDPETVDLCERRVDAIDALKTEDDVYDLSRSIIDELIDAANQPAMKGPTAPPPPQPGNPLRKPDDDAGDGDADGSASDKGSSAASKPSPSKGDDKNKDADSSDQDDSDAAPKDPSSKKDDPEDKDATDQAEDESGEGKDPEDKSDKDPSKADGQKDDGDAGKDDASDRDGTPKDDSPGTEGKSGDGDDASAGDADSGDSDADDGDQSDADDGTTPDEDADDGDEGAGPGNDDGSDGDAESGDDGAGDAGTGDASGAGSGASAGSESDPKSGSGPNGDDQADGDDQGQGPQSDGKGLSGNDVGSALDDDADESDGGLDISDIVKEIAKQTQAMAKAIASQHGKNAAPTNISGVRHARVDATGAPVAAVRGHPQISSAIRTIVIAQSKVRTNRNRDEGVFDRKAIVPQAIGRTDVYKRVVRSRAIDTAWLTLIDKSVSMTGIITIAGDIAASTAESAFAFSSLKTSIQSYTSGGSGYDQLVVQTIKEFDEPMVAARSRYNAWRQAARSDMGGTPTGDAILEGVRVLDKRREERKVMLVITDGDPDCVDLTMAAHGLAKARGIITCLIEIGHHDKPKLPFDIGIVASSMEELPQAMIEIAKQTIGAKTH